MLRAFGAGIAVTALLTTGTVQAAESAQVTKHFQFGPVQVHVSAAAEPSDLLTVADELTPGRPSEYWLGLAAAQVRGALRAQLGLPEGQGLVVLSVLPDSPAKKAGIVEHDVLVKAADKPLDRVQDLIAAVDAAQGKALTLEVIRAGKHEKVDIQPVKRPEGLAAQAPGWTEQGNWRDWQKWLEETMPGDEGRGPLRFRIFRPGTILPPGGLGEESLPKDMTITITRSGSEPAKIVVQQGDKRWETTEKDLGKLPENVRGHVERMLHPTVGWRASEGPATPMLPEASRRMDRLLEQRLEQMNRQIDAMRKSLEELRGRQSQGKAPDAAKPEKPKAEEPRPSKI